MNTPTRLSLAIVLLLSVSCSVQETSAPPFTGPSELALSVQLQAVPDSILQDGASQSSILVDALGPANAPARNLPMRVEMEFEGVIQDFGSVSAKTIVTGEDGKARFTYTAPPRPVQTPSLGYNEVALRVTPIGTDYGSQIPRTVHIKLVPPGVILPPNSPPQPQFTFSPSAPAVMTNVAFDASGTIDGGAPCGPSCTYSWDFGDGGKATGIFANHQFSSQGTFQVRLTATDTGGASATVAQPVTVGQGGAPTASFTFSPTTPAVGQQIFFNAQASTASAGRTLVAYDWDFGSGRTGTGVTINKGYDTPGTYVVTLTVTDDAGRKATVSQNVVVGGTPPTAAFTFSPTTPDVGQTVFFNAATSRAAPGRQIVSYLWDFGAGQPQGSGLSPTTVYATAGTYTVTLVVVDDRGERGTTSQTIAIGVAPLEAVLTVSPNTGNTTVNFFFDGRGSRGPFAITEYRFTFGDGTADQVGASPTATHTYAAAGTYTARLTIRDSSGRTATVTTTVSVQP